jgi:hypothetical protein
VPASPLLYSGRIYAETTASVDTGLAIANPGEQSAVISFYFSNATGSFGNGSVTILPHQQIAAFLSQSPFGGPKSLSGTFTFNSTAPVAAIALRGLSNERRELLITTLPVSDLNAAPSQRELDLPQLADGGGWTTQIVLVNTGDGVATGRVVFISPSGSPLALTVNGQPGSTFPYSVPPRSSIRMQTAGTGNDAKSGRVRVVPKTTRVRLRVSTFFRIEAAELQLPRQASRPFHQEMGFDSTGKASAPFLGRDRCRPEWPYLMYRRRTPP